MLEQAELWRKSGQRGHLIASYKTLEKRLCYGHNPCDGGSLCPCTLGTTRVPASQAAAPPSCPTLTGAQLPQSKKVLHLCMQSLRLCPTLCDSVDCGLSGFFVREGASPGKNTGVYWPILVAIPGSVQFSSVAQLCLTLRPHESQHARPPCPAPTPRVHSNSCPSSQ